MSAARQERGEDADFCRMNVFAADGTLVVRNYRWSQRLDSADDGGYDIEA